MTGIRGAFHPADSETDAIGGKIHYDWSSGTYQDDAGNIHPWYGVNSWNSSAGNYHNRITKGMVEGFANGYYWAGVAYDASAHEDEKGFKCIWYLA